MSYKSKLEAKRLKSGIRRAWILAGLMVLPFVVLLIFFLWRSGHLQEDGKRGRAERAARQQRVEALSSSLEKSGALVSCNQSGVVTITLPVDVAMQISDRLAKETALKAHERTDCPVKVTTPAGQILAEAP